MPVGIGRRPLAEFGTLPIPPAVFISLAHRSALRTHILKKFPLGLHWRAPSSATEPTGRWNVCHQNASRFRGDLGCRAALPCPLAFCPALPCPALPCPAPCPALPCPALPQTPGAPPRKTENNLHTPKNTKKDSLVRRRTPHTKQAQ